MNMELRDWGHFRAAFFNEFRDPDQDLHAADALVGLQRICMASGSTHSLNNYTDSFNHLLHVLSSSYSIGQPSRPGPIQDAWKVVIYWNGLWPEIQEKLAVERHTFRSIADLRRRAHALCFPVGAPAYAILPSPAAPHGSASQAATARGQRTPRDLRHGSSSPSGPTCSHPAHRRFRHAWADCRLNPDCPDFDPEQLRQVNERMQKERAIPHALSAISAPPPDHGNYDRTRLPADYAHVGTVLSDQGNRYHLLDPGPAGTMYLARERPPENEEAGADWRD